MRVLFVTRNHKGIGGMQTVSRALYSSFSEQFETKLLAWTGPRWALPLGVVVLAALLLWSGAFRRRQVVYLQDGLLAPLLVISRVTRCRSVITIHGLELTFPNRLYQTIVTPWVRVADAVVAISSATAQICLEHGVAPQKLHVIGDAVLDVWHSQLGRQRLRTEVGHALHLNIDARQVVLSVGRLVPRKGFGWFIRSVMPELLKSHETSLYLIVGRGHEESNLRALIEAGHLQDHVVLTGGLNDDTLKALYNASDCLVMPNVHIPGDFEGFGLVAAEGASAGLPVVASRLEGIADAVIEGMTGFLVEPNDERAFASRIGDILDGRAHLDPDQVRRCALDNFSWQVVAARYAELFQKICAAA